ncbi:MAG: protein kinase, partial [Gemmatimonadales bacterium]
MDPNRWRRLESLCLDALDLPSGERSGFLDRACGDDPALRGEVESVLREVERDPSFLERPLVDPIALGLEGAAAEPPLPEAIAGYRIERLLGRGGMGDVYLAIQTSEDLRQPVALKVIKRGMATDEVLARFRQERRILASLNHPNIARLLDAGATEDGRPYFLMELVEGLPLDQYCERRAVSIADRLRLFQVICDAVQHAHQNLVVHRDLKPSNIVVTDTGIPKLLDFGIGKVLAPTEWLSPGVETRTEARRLTPDYAAPEQLAGGPTTTATDVYSLGVLLYQLLTGRHPFPGRRTTGSRLRPGAIEVTADRPSAVVDDPDRRRRLAGDLDTIALKALRREPERRYQSARALADDLGRHLAGLPVSARPDTLGYRTRKFIRRHAAWVATATIAIAALVAVTIVTLVQSKRVAAESARVAAERDKALEVRGFLMEMFGATGSGQSVGDTVSVRRLLDLQAARLDSLYPDRPEVRADMMEVLADGYDRLGLPLAAEPLALAALGLRRATLPPEHPDVATSLNLVGWITHEVGRSRDAEPILREAVAIRRSGGPALREDLSRSLNDLGVVLSALSQYQEAETVLAEALAIRLATLGPEHRAVGITANNLAAAYYYEARYPEAFRTQDIALRALRATVGPEHQRTVVALANLAAFKRTLGV